MLDGLVDGEINSFLDEHPMIVLLFEIDVLSNIEPYIENAIDHEVFEKLDPTSIKELQQARDALDRKVAISQRVKGSTLENVNLGSPSEPRTVKIAKDLATSDRSALIGLLTEYQDVFAWSYSDMKGLDPQYYQHQIHLQTDARPIQQRRYRMNPNYVAKVKDEIDKLLCVGFIRPVKRATWLSPIVVVTKKNGQIRVFVDYRKLNVVTITNAFPIPFTDNILNTVAGHDCYSFLDGFNGYNQIRMHPDDQEKTTFITEWGVFVVVVMMFGLKTTLTTFHQIIMEIFDDYIPTFIHVFLDDFSVYGCQLMHLD